MMHIIKELIIYPIKGLVGISVNKALALKAGFEHDRRWMLVDEHQKFVTQRTQPNMALFVPEIKDGKILINYKDEVDFFDLEDRIEDNYIQTKVWGDDAVVQAVNEDVSEWFSDILQQKVSLVRMKDENARIHHNSTKNIDIHVSLADGYPYLMAGTESLHHLNTKLTSPIEMNRFRPNIIVETKFSHEEDMWGNVQIGSADFLNIKPCARCNVITIDQQTAIVNNEPLKVLNTYRKEGNSVLFGTNMMCTNEGIVGVGDQLIPIVFIK